MRCTPAYASHGRVGHSSTIAERESPQERIPPSSSSTGPPNQPFEEKRKRCRVTPEQLTHLETFFASERSPTAIRRREISEMLGMNDRQTQIWFQNRRAKEKQQLEKRKTRSHSGGPPSPHLQDLSLYEAEIASIIHEEGSITLIPCADITIGSWRRVSTSRFDLIAYINEQRQCLAWYIQSSGYGFKMETPFDWISEIELQPSFSDQAVLTFTLSSPPYFFMEVAASPGSEGPSHRTWYQCADWTAGQQASTVLRHELVGTSTQLSQVAADLKATKLSAYTSTVVHAAHPETHTPIHIPAPLAQLTEPSPPIDHHILTEGRSVTTSLQAYPSSSTINVYTPPQLNATNSYTSSHDSASYTTFSHLSPYNRQSSPSQVSSAPANAVSFFQGDDLAHPSEVSHTNAYETYRRHSSVTFPASYTDSPSSPPPAIAYARRSSDDATTTAMLDPTTANIAPFRSLSQPQFMGDSPMSGGTYLSASEASTPPSISYDPLSPRFAYPENSTGEDDTLIAQTYYSETSPNASEIPYYNHAADYANPGYVENPYFSSGQQMAMETQFHSAHTVKGPTSSEAL
jgi:regulatory protein PHO2